MLVFLWTYDAEVLHHVLVLASSFNTLLESIEHHSIGVGEAGAVHRTDAILENLVQLSDKAIYALPVFILYLSCAGFITSRITRSIWAVSVKPSVCIWKV